MDGMQKQQINSGNTNRSSDWVSYRITDTSDPPGGIGRMNDERVKERVIECSVEDEGMIGEWLIVERRREECSNK